MNFSEIITIEPGKRSGQPCVRGMRISVRDILEYLAGGMTVDEVLEDFPELTIEDVRACPPVESPTCAHPSQMLHRREAVRCGLLVMGFVRGDWVLGCGCTKRRQPAIVGLQSSPSTLVIGSVASSRKCGK